MACDVPGATILAPLPGFVMYEMSAQLQGLRFVGVPLTRRLRARRGGDARGHRRAPAGASSTSPIRTTRPPTCSTTRAVERIVAAVGAQDGLVVFDEAYQPFSVAQLDATASARHRTCCVMRTLSKFGLAGVRLGYLAGPGGADRRDRQGAPALQHQRAQRRGDAVRAGARRRVRAPGGAAARASARACSASSPRMPGVTRVARARPT